jgi:hypothetical protein
LREKIIKFSQIPDRNLRIRAGLDLRVLWEISIDINLLITVFHSSLKLFNSFSENIDKKSGSPGLFKLVQDSWTPFIITVICHFSLFHCFRRELPRKRLYEHSPCSGNSGCQNLKESGEWNICQYSGLNEVWSWGWVSTGGFHNKYNLGKYIWMCLG